MFPTLKSFSLSIANRKFDIQFRGTHLGANGVGRLTRRLTRRISYSRYELSKF